MTDHMEGNTPAAGFKDAVFVVGGTDQLQRVRERYQGELDEEQQRALDDDWTEEIRRLQVRIGTLLKTDAVSFLFGAGVSKDCGGVLFGSVPKEIEERLLGAEVQGVEPPQVDDWLLHFYRAVEEVSAGEAGAPTDADAVAQRRADFDDAAPLQANYEEVVSQLYRWRSALGHPGSGALHVTTGRVDFKATAEDLQEAIEYATKTLADTVRLPVKGKESELHSFQTFCRKVLTLRIPVKPITHSTARRSAIRSKPIAPERSDAVLV